MTYKTTTIAPMPRPEEDAAADWWRSATIYQIYPRSFADADGDGIGDLRGIAERMDALADLGVDAIWLSPFYVSPQRDAGYDVADYRAVDPLFGTLDDFDHLVARAHGLGLRVIVDLVPNHSSDQHAWFQQALAAGPESGERARYIFREGRGAYGEQPPNNWLSCFGGPAWTRIVESDGTPGQWYLHLFDSSQPDFDWANPEVHREFEDILRFWLARGVDGFRVDVAHGLVKEPGYPDYPPLPSIGAAGNVGGGTSDSLVDAAGDAGSFFASTPYWGQEGVHEIYRVWNSVLREFGPDRILCAEAWVEPMDKLARWVRPDEMHQAFNFTFLSTPWRAAALRDVIDESLRAFGAVGAPTTWVFSNHDVVRHATRLSLHEVGPAGYGIGPRTPNLPDVDEALRRGVAATALMLALPGSAYLYQGEELGLPEVIEIDDAARQDPAWARTGGERYGRDGCRVPIPWAADEPAYGFNATGASWLPQPVRWRALARDRQAATPGSVLNRYRDALALRRERDLGGGTLRWLPAPEDVLAFTNAGTLVVSNLGEAPFDVGAVFGPSVGRRVFTSVAQDTATVGPDTTAWYDLVGRL